MDKVSYIYALYDPRDPLIVRYIGKAQDVDGRLRGHIKEAQDRVGYSLHRLNWIRYLLKAGVQPQVRVIEAVNKNWALRERYWIKEYKRRNHSLTNSTDGGEGLLNPSKETSEKRSSSLRIYYESSKGLNRKKNLSKLRRGVPLSLSVRTKMSEAQRRYYSTAESNITREKIAAAFRGVHRSYETRRKLSLAGLQHHSSPAGVAHRKAVGDAHRGKSLSLEHRRKTGESLRQYYASKNGKARLRKGVSLETRQKMSESALRRRRTPV